LLKVDLRSDPSLLAVIRSMMSQLCEGLGFSAEDCRRVTRAVDEALSNVMRHAYNGDLDRTIQMYVRRLETRGRNVLEIVLEDSGPELDPTKLPARPLEEVRPGGLGLHFIRESMDEVEYERTGSINRLRLSKYLVPKNAPQDSGGV
jgi:anti-sigma regulatory factor (Ser/Thr protein kinase)